MSFIPEIINSNSTFTKIGKEARLNLKYVPYGNTCLNETATKIYECCNGNNRIDDIVDILSTEYPNIPKKKIELDVISMLRQFYNLGIIKWKTQNYFNGDLIYETSYSSIKIIWVDEIEEMNIQYKNCLASPYVNESVFFESNGLPYKIFNGELMMLVYFDKENNEKLQLLVSFERSDTLLTMHSMKYNSITKNMKNYLFDSIEAIVGINRNVREKLNYIFYSDNVKDVELLEGFDFKVNSTISNKCKLYQCVKLNGF